MALENVDTVAWNTLTASSGQATEIPSLLKNLTSPETTIREAALEQLLFRTCNQTTICEATAYTAPFLVELLTVETVQDKSSILMLLSTMAQGASYTENYYRGVLHKYPEQKEDFKAEFTWVQRTRDAVADGYQVYLRLLARKEISLTSWAIYALSFCLPYAQDILPHLAEQFSKESDDVVRACLILCLGDLFSRERDSFPFFLTILHEQNSHLLKVAAAMALTRLLGKNTPEEAIQEMLLVCEHPFFVKDQFGLLPWVNCGVEAMLSQLFRSIGMSIASLVLPVLVNALLHIDEFDAIYFVPNLLYFAFQGQSVASQSTVEMLTETQRNVLLKLVTYDPIWTFGNTTSSLYQFGLPGRRERLREFLHLSSAS
jgi:hypothetical protein